MVPKVTSAGRSFKGAARYYLHDKQADTAERVAFVETVNLPTDDPRRAVAQMIDVAAHSKELKKAAGIRGGRNLDKPVYTYALTWHPSENPTQAEQLDAARQSLEALGMADRQAIIIAHDDAAHPHVHVMVNRVCPETGRAASNSNDHLKLSEWAEAYEKKHGRVFCDERVKNNEARKRGEWRKDQSDTRKVWLEWKKAQTRDLWDAHRAETAKMQPARKSQFDALYRQKEDRFALRRDEIKQLYKPIWRDVFKRQQEELKDFDAGLVGRLKFVMKQDKGKLAGVLSAVVGKKDLRAEFIRDQEAKRAEIAKTQRQTIRDSGREMVKAWKYDRDALRDAHKAEDQARYDHTKETSKAIWEQPEGAQQDFQQSNEKEPEAPRRRSARQIIQEQKERERPRRRSRPRDDKGPSI